MLGVISGLHTLIGKQQWSLLTFKSLLMGIRGDLVQAPNVIAADPCYYGLYLPTAVLVGCFSAR